MPDDKVPKDLFLNPDLKYIDDYNALKEEDIYIIQFPKAEELKCSEGKITSIKDSEFSHSACTEKGSSGSPIILKRKKKIIGIHKGGNKFEPENYGDFLYPIIKILEGKKKSFDLVPHGYGVLYLNNGEVYKGNFVNGKR